MNLTLHASASGSISRETTAAAPATRRSSMRSKRWPRLAPPGALDERIRRNGEDAPLRRAEQLRRPLGDAPERAAPDARPRPIRRRYRAAAHAARRLCALAARAREDRED